MWEIQFFTACILATLRRFAERAAFSAKDTQPRNGNFPVHVMQQSDQSRNLEARVVRAAEAALTRQHYVSAIDVLCGMGLLAPTHLENWRKGRVDCLERVIQGNLQKISRAMESFRRWAREKELKPSETGYVRRTRGGPVPLRFSRSGDESIEVSYRTHYVSPVLSERKQQKLQEKLEQPTQLVAYQILHAAQCSECGAELDQGSLLVKEAEQPLCLDCAGLGDLEFLGAGDAALTRRTTKYSDRMAVVVRFSRSRKRYERQGVLAETAALEQAERECLDDAEERAAARVRDAERRREEDRKLTLRMTEEFGRLFPGCTPVEREAIAAHTAVRGSVRVGRSVAGRNLEERALTAAVIASIRHRHTNYDELLGSGVDREHARRMVAEKIDRLLETWRTPRK
jgi:hypothetical protein